VRVHTAHTAGLGPVQLPLCAACLLSDTHAIALCERAAAPRTFVCRRTWRPAGMRVPPALRWRRPLMAALLRRAMTDRSRSGASCPRSG
jgi:hypothetical protein